MIKYRNEELKRIIDAACNQLQTYNRGATLTFELLETLLECTKYDEYWTYRWSRLRRRIMRERGIYCRSLLNVGYRMCLHDEQLVFCSSMRQKRARRHLRRAIREVESVDPGALSLHQQKLRALTLDNLKHERRVIMRCTKEQATITKPETLPKRQLAAI